MGRATVGLLILMGLLVLFLPKFIFAQKRPMCISQFALANQACSILPARAAPIDPNRMRSQEEEGGDHDDNEDDNDDDDDEHEHHRHKRGRGRGHKRGHGEEPRANKDCCRWLEEIDGECVCEALKSLPPFLTKPKHNYSVQVGSTCKLNFKCIGV